jgi:hypothetical protein
MKRTIISLTIIFTLILTTQVTIGQEKNIEKKIERRVKIVTIDENGQKVVIDTIYHGDFDEEELISKMGNAMVLSIDEKDISVESGEGNLFVVKKGDGNVFMVKSKSDNDSMVWVDKEHGEMDIGTHGQTKIFITEDENEAHSHNSVTKSGNEKEIFITVDKSDDSGKKFMMKVDAKELGENERVITIKSADSVEEFIIKGDATITIKDGNLEVESSSKMINKKEEKRTIVEEKEVKKSKKK